MREGLLEFGRKTLSFLLELLATMFVFFTAFLLFIIGACSTAAPAPHVYKTANGNYVKVVGSKTTLVDGPIDGATYTEYQHEKSYTCGTVAHRLVCTTPE